MHCRFTSSITGATIATNRAGFNAAEAEAGGGPFGGGGGGGGVMASAAAGGTAVSVGGSHYASSGSSTSVKVGGVQAETHGINYSMDPNLKAGLAAAAAVTAVAGLATAAVMAHRRAGKAAAGVVDSPTCALCNASFGVMNWRHACLHCRECGWAAVRARARPPARDSLLPFTSRAHHRRARRPHHLRRVQDQPALPLRRPAQGQEGLQGLPAQACRNGAPSGGPNGAPPGPPPWPPPGGPCAPPFGCPAVVGGAPAPPLPQCSRGALRRRSPRQGD